MGSEDTSENHENVDRFWEGNEMNEMNRALGHLCAHIG